MVKGYYLTERNKLHFCRKFFFDEKEAYFDYWDEGGTRSLISVQVSYIRQSNEFIGLSDFHLRSPGTHANNEIHWISTK